MDGDKRPGLGESTEQPGVEQESCAGWELGAGMVPSLLSRIKKSDFMLKSRVGLLTRGVTWSAGVALRGHSSHTSLQKYRK